MRTWVFVAWLLLQVQGELSALLPQSVHGECVGVVVTPEVVLLPAHCAQSLGKHDNSQQATALGATVSDITKVQIRRVTIPPLYCPGEMVFDFALGYVKPGTLALSGAELHLDGGPEVKTREDQVRTNDLIVYSLRQTESSQDESDSLTLTTRGFVAFDASSACDTKQTANSGSANGVCVGGKWEDKEECENGMSGRQVVVRCVNDRDYSYGFVSRSPRCSEHGEQIFTVSPIANALEFIGRELPQFDSHPSVIDQADGVLTTQRRRMAPDSSGADTADGQQPASVADSSLHKKYLVTLYDSLTPLGCSGALIAPIFIFTTATCTLSHQITHVFFGRTGGFEFIIQFQTIVHPQYVSGYSRFDVAILQLEAPLYEQKTTLSFDPGLVGDKLVRVSQDGVTDQVVINELSKCTSTDLSLATGDEASGVLACVSQTLPRSGAVARIVSRTSSTRLRQGKSGARSLPIRHQSSQHLNQYLSRFPVLDQRQNFRHLNQALNPGSNTNTISTCVIPHSSSRSSADVPPHPYLVGLRITKDGRNFCGGVLIGPFHVLTAAYCVNDGIVSWVSIGSPSPSWSVSQDIPVEGINPHPLFPSASGLNDVAILKLGFYAGSARWAELATASDFPDKTAATMATFGTMSSNTLKRVGVPIWARKVCEAQYPNVDGTILCAGGEAGNDACSGGP